MNETKYTTLVSHFAKNGELTTTQQVELDCIQGIGDIHPNSRFWVRFLPGYLLMSRRDDEIINTAALVEAIQAKGGGRRGGAIGLDALAEGLAARLEDRLPNSDPVGLARAVVKLATPAIDQAIENAIADAVQPPRVDLAPLLPMLQQTQAGLREASRDAMLNRNVIIVALASVLMCGIGAWWGGQQADAQWKPLVQQLRDQLNHLGTDSHHLPHREGYATRP